MRRTYLKPDERAVLQAKSEGLTEKEIARRLGISASAVKRRVLNAYELLDARNAVQGASKAITLGKIVGPSTDSCTPWVHTEMEQQIRDLLITGATCKEMADQLGTAYHTVETRIEDMRQRNGARNKPHLAAMIIKTNLSN